MAQANQNRSWHELTEAEQMQRQAGTMSAMPPKSKTAKAMATGPVHDPITGEYNAHIFVAPSKDHELVDVRRFAKGGASAGTQQMPNILVAEIHRGHFEPRMWNGATKDMFVSDGIIGRAKLRIADNEAVTYTAVVKFDRDYGGWVADGGTRTFSVWLNQNSTAETPWSLSFKPSGQSVDPQRSNYDDL